MEIVTPKELSRIKRARGSTSEEGIDNGSTLVHQRIGKERESTRCNLETVKWLKTIAGFKHLRTLEKAEKKTLLLGGGSIR